MIDPDSYIRASDLNDRISYLYQVIWGRDPVSTRQINRWKKALGINKPRGHNGVYRGYEYNMLIYVMEGLLKTSDLCVTVLTIISLIDEGDPYVQLRSQTEADQKESTRDYATIDI